MKKLEPFNLEVYKANPTKKVVTRDGRPVRILATDFNNPSGPIIGVVLESSGEILRTYFEDGFYKKGDSSNADLHFEVESKEYWVNVYNDDFGPYVGSLFPSKETALEYISNCDLSKTKYLQTIKIWEE